MNANIRGLISSLLMSILFAILFYNFYQKINYKNLENNNFEFDLSDEMQNYSILSDKNCIGTLQTNLEDQGKAYAINSNGLINYKIYNNNTTINYTLFLSFNKLNQLNKANFIATKDNIEINLTSNKVNPINSIIEFKKDNKIIWSRKFTLPGPFKLLKLKNGLYSFSSSSRQIKGKKQIKGISEKLKINISKNIACKNFEFLNLDPLMAELNTFIPQLGKAL